MKAVILFNVLQHIYYAMIASPLKCSLNLIINTSIPFNDTTMNERLDDLNVINTRLCGTPFSFRSSHLLQTSLLEHFDSYGIFYNPFKLYQTGQ